MMRIPVGSMVWRVDACRVAEGGDIFESYSGDRIAFAKPLRAPFTFAGALWVVVATGYALTLGRCCKAYRLESESFYKGPSRCGYYDGCEVKLRDRIYIMVPGSAAFFVGR